MPLVSQTVSRRSGWWATFLCGLLGIAAALPRPAQQATTLLALFPPWWAADKAWAAANSVGYVLDISTRSPALVVHSEAGQLAARLRRAGAWLVIDPLLAWGCGPHGKPT